MASGPEAWTAVQRRRRGRRGQSQTASLTGASLGMTQPEAAVAVLRALISPSEESRRRRSARDERRAERGPGAAGSWKPEWQCAQCHKRNFLDRDACRNCGKPHDDMDAEYDGQGRLHSRGPSAQRFGTAPPTPFPAPPPFPPPMRMPPWRSGTASGARQQGRSESAPPCTGAASGSGTAGPAQPLPAAAGTAPAATATASASALLIDAENALAAARRAGFPPDVLDVLEAQVRPLREAAAAARAAARPIGAQLDSARARCTRAAQALERSKAAVAAAAAKLVETQAEVDEAEAALAALMEKATALRAELTSGAPPATEEDKDALASLLMAVEQTWMPAAVDCGPGGIPERLAAAVEQARRSLSRTRSPTERAGSSQPRGTAEAAAMAVPCGGLDDDIEISDAEEEEPAAASAASAEAASAEKRKAALEEAMMALAAVAECTSEVPRETAERAVAAADVVRALMQAQTKRRKTGNVPSPQQRAQQQQAQAVQQAFALQQAQAMHQHHQQQQHELAQQQMFAHQHLQLQHMQQQHQAPS